MGRSPFVPHAVDEVDVERTPRLGVRGAGVEIEYGNPVRALGW